MNCPLALNAIAEGRTRYKLSKRSLRQLKRKTNEGTPPTATLRLS